MTTVAYDHKNKTISVDGRITVNDTIVCDDYDKTIDDGNRIFFFCGKVSDYGRLISADNGAIELDVDACALCVFGGEVYRCSVNQDGRFEQVRLTHSSAIGRGDEVALTAMDYGATSKEAVIHASKRTTSTGGKIRTYDIANGRWID